MDDVVIVDVGAVCELQHFVELLRRKRLTLLLLMFGERRVEKRVFRYVLPFHSLVESAAQYLVNVVNERRADFVALGLSRICYRLSLEQQEVIVVVHRLCPDAPQLLVSKVRMHIVFQQPYISVVGGGHPLLLAVLLNELIEKLAHGHVVLVNMDVLSNLIFQLGFPRFRGVVAQARFPNLMSVLAFSLIENDGVGLSSFDD